MLCLNSMHTRLSIIKNKLTLPSFNRSDGQRLTHRELRERIERQRSVATPKVTRSDSLEGLNLEMHHTRSSVERLDTQVSTLHNDVATLSIEVGLIFQIFISKYICNIQVSLRFKVKILKSRIYA